MYPKYRSLITLILLLLLGTQSYSHSPAVFNERPSLSFDFETCFALGATASSDYSEMQPKVIQNSECTDLSMLSPSLFRVNPTVNRHSCAPGFQGGTAMCVSASDNCIYVPNDLRAVRLAVLVNPGPDGLGSLERISFQSKSPEFFEFVDGTTGLNNYATRLRVRITTNNKEVYLSDEIPTTLDWTLKNFDLDNLPGLTVSTSTVFLIEITPYCLIGNGATSEAWDIDDLVVSSGCTSLNGGIIQTSSNTEFCSVDTNPQVVDLNVSGARGDGFAWVALDINNNIAIVSDQPSINVQGLSGGKYFIHHLAYVDQLTGLMPGVNLSTVQGCFDLSNPIEVNMNTVLGGSLLTNTGSGFFDFCVNLDNNQFFASLDGNVGAQVEYALVGNNNFIQQVFPTSSIDLINVPTGTYNLFAVSSTGPLVNLGAGGFFDSVSGCFAISNPILVTVNAEGVSAGSLSVNGQTTFDFCGPGGPLQLNLSGNFGPNSRFVVTNFNGNILRIQDQNPIDLSGLSETQCFVRHISFEDGLTGLTIGEVISDFEGCFDLSNSVVVNKNNGLDGLGGTLTTPNGDTTFTVCPNQNNFIFNAVLTGSGGANVLYILAEGDIIRFVFDTPTINLALVDNSTFSLYAISSNGVLNGLTVGQPISAIEGCFVLSNPIDISTNSADMSGGILTVGGQMAVDLCNSGDPLDLELTGALGTLSTFLATNSLGEIILIDENNLDELNNLPGTDCNVWHLSYEPGISGLEVGLLASNLTGCFDLSNPVNVTKSNVIGGVISSGGLEDIELCLTTDEITALPVTLSGASGANSSIVITDTNGEILQLTALDINGTIDLDTSLPSQVQIVNISYSSTINNLEAGNNLADVFADCFAISNTLSVIREIVVGGTIDGPQSRDICLNDIGNTGFSVTVSNEVGNFSTFLVTDENGAVLETNTTGAIDFAGTPPGTCFIYHLSHAVRPITYDGPPSIATLSLECFSLSTPVSVVRKEVAGGTISTNSGASSVTVVIDPNNPATLDITLSGETGEENDFIITDSAGTILGIQNESQFTFDTVGECFIQNISYCNDVPNLVIGVNLTDLNGCFDLSNQIQVIKEEVVVVTPLFPGVISNSDGLDVVDICFGQVAVDQIVNVIFQDQPTGGDSSVFLILDDFGAILEILSDPVFEFDENGLGSYVITHLVFESANFSGLQIGGSITDLTGDFALSNSIVVTGFDVGGGTLTTTDTLTNIEVIIGDGMTDQVDLLTEGSVGDSSLIIITDDIGTILEFPTLPLQFDDNSSPGTCMVWNLTFNETLVGLELGLLIADLDGCFALSNPVTIVKTEEVIVQDTLAGGVLTGDVMNICLGQDSLLVTTLLMAEGDTSTYVVTDPSGIILEIVENTGFTGTTLTFGANVPPGLCDIWHISSTGPLTGLALGEDLDTLSGNFELSNAIVVDRRAVDGGLLTTPSGLDTFNIIVGDGIEDLIDVTVTGAVGDSVQWVITDQSGIVLDLPLAPPFSFENSGPGICLIWNISSSFDATISIGDNATLLDGCYGLSNAIVVNKESPMMTGVDGGVLLTSDGLDTIEICLLSSMTTLDDVLLTGVVGDSSSFILTDLSGFILAQFDNPPFNFDNTFAGTCQVWHVSSNGDVANLSPGSLVSNLMGDFDLSNPITVLRDDPSGGSLMTPAGMTEVTITVGAMVSDSIDLTLADADGDVLQFVITDTTGIILDLPLTEPINFVNSSPGICQIWNLSYATGLTGLAIGNNISQLAGCFDFSNPVTVTKEEEIILPVGGTLLTDDGLMVAEVCLSLNPQLSLNLTGNQGANSDFVIIDPTGLIIGIFDVASPTFSIPGACEVVHISSDSTLTGLALNANINDLGGNFSLSNSVGVTKIDFNGGLLTAPNGFFRDTIVVGDGIDETLTFINTQTLGDSLLYVITTATDTILEIQESNSILFSDLLPAGECRVRTIAFSGDLPAGLEIGNNFNLDLTGCFDPSNVVTVVKEQFVSVVLAVGTISTFDGADTLDVCVGANGGIVDLEVVGANGANQSWVPVSYTHLTLPTIYSV